MTTVYFTKERREDVINQLIDCCLEVGEIEPDNAQEYRARLNSLSNWHLYMEVRDCGWDIQ